MQTNPPNPPNHYTTLSLPPTANISQIKLAYRTSLLLHHPDKSKSPHTLKPSIDAIKIAYSILSDPQSRRTYDLELSKRNGDAGAEGKFHTGEEAVDLDDLEYDAEAGVWFRGCRCGEVRGYTVTEVQLDEEETRGGREVMVGCKGCSLWIRVGFDVVVEEDERDEEAQ